ncbi:hypothetical protein KP509_14G056800 [Ceratopteris richardii]|uniref:Uncharacterized protein n=1 Tax=Ceratopteris richardii TaxID=49495 RepID=A0A8T2T861_CERRI|nr:hypothetical protein KP509_14G056800 [Ceratopteris richardii]
MISHAISSDYDEEEYITIEDCSFAMDFFCLRTSLCRVAFKETEDQDEHLCNSRSYEGNLNETRNITNQVDASIAAEFGDLAEDINSSGLGEGQRDSRETYGKAQNVKEMQESVQYLECLLKEHETSESDDDHKIGALCLRLAQLYASKDEDPDKILVYGQRAFKILGTPEISLDSATCLELVGCAYHKKGEYEKAVTHLERAAFILDNLKTTVKEEEMGGLQYAVQAHLGQSNMALGRIGEAMVNFQVALAIDERLLNSQDPKLGKIYHQIAQAFMQVQDLHEALVLCLKALPIYMNCYGSVSFEVAELRKLLSAIYYGLDDFENALSEHQITRQIFEACKKPEEVASMDLASGEVFLCLDKYAQAITKLKDVVKQTTPFNHCHAQALVLLAKAYAFSKKKKSAITYCKQALEVLQNNIQSVKAGASSVELALVFQQLDEIEQSLSTFKMGLEIYQKYPEERPAIAFIEGQIGLIYLRSGRTQEALPYLEKSLASKEVVLGLKNTELLEVYNHLGRAYMNLGKFEEALMKLEAGRRVADESDITNDPALVTLFNNLATAYLNLGRLDDAISTQKLLVHIMKRTGLKTEIQLEDAEQKLMSMLKAANKD